MKNMDKSICRILGLQGVAYLRPEVIESSLKVRLKGGWSDGIRGARTSGHFELGLAASGLAINNDQNQ